MKVEYCEQVEVTGIAHISIEDIQAALTEAMAVAENEANRDVANERQKQFAVNGFVNAIFQCLEGIGEEARAATSRNVRQSFSDALRKHADRWACEKPESTNCE